MNTWKLRYGGQTGPRIACGYHTCNYFIKNTYYSHLHVFQSWIQGQVMKHMNVGHQDEIPH